MNQKKKEKEMCNRRGSSEVAIDKKIWYSTYKRLDTVIGFTLSFFPDRLFRACEKKSPGDTMEFQPSLPITIHPDCVEFVRVIEALLLFRQQEAGRGRKILPYDSWEDEWGPRKWHRTELEDMVYSSYKRMRQGHITRPPRREVVMEIADYFQCTLLERNRLLLAAHTFPVELYLTGLELERVLRVVIETACVLPIPAMIINRDWRIHYLNESILRLYDVSPEQIAALPASSVNMLQLLFDPALPLYPNLIVNRESWVQMALQTLYGFKMANLLSMYEPWYQQVVSQLARLPEFSWYWQQVHLEKRVEAAPTSAVGVTLETTVPRLGDPSRSLSLRPLVISTGYFHYTFPQIIGLLPISPEGQAIFEEIGLPYLTSLPGGQVVL
jgi:MmyB-like transcription regulator ligand binding domain